MINKNRAGMTVQTLIDKLSNIKDKNKYVACNEFGFGGVSGVNEIKEVSLTSYAGAYSFETTDVVVLMN